MLSHPWWIIGNDPIAWTPALHLSITVQVPLCCWGKKKKEKKKKEKKKKYKLSILCISLFADCALAAFFLHRSSLLLIRVERSSIFFFLLPSLFVSSLFYTDTAHAEGRLRKVIKKKEY